MSEPMLLTLNKVIEPYHGETARAPCAAGVRSSKQARAVPTRRDLPQELFAPAPTEINDPAPDRRL
jgi:hypothetical protein